MEVRALAVACAAALLGCGEVKPCREGTVLVTLTFDDAARTAETIDVGLSLGGAPEQHNPVMLDGQPRATLEIDFPSYPAGQVLQLSVVALRGQATVGRSPTVAVTLEPGCTARELAVTAAAVRDAGVDAAHDPSASPADLAVPLDQAVVVAQDLSERNKDADLSGGTLTSRYIFVSSQLFTGNLAAAGSPDTVCDVEAQKGGLPGTYRALIASSSFDGISRFGLAGGTRPILLPGGQQVATEGTLFSAVKHLAPINKDASQGLVASCVWTGYDDSGVLTMVDCEGWTSDVKQGTAGSSSAQTAGWANLQVNGLTCQSSCRVYCLTLP